MNFHNIPISHGILTFYLLILSHITAFSRFPCASFVLGDLQPVLRMGTLHLSLQ